MTSCWLLPNRCHCHLFRVFYWFNCSHSLPSSTRSDSVTSSFKIYSFIDDIPASHLSPRLRHTNHHQFRLFAIVDHHKISCIACRTEINFHFNSRISSIIPNYFRARNLFRKTPTSSLGKLLNRCGNLPFWKIIENNIWQFHIYIYDSMGAGLIHTFSQAKRFTWLVFFSSAISLDLNVSPNEIIIQLQ